MTDSGRFWMVQEGPAMRKVGSYWVVVVLNDLHGQGIVGSINF